MSSNASKDKKKLNPAEIANENMKLEIAKELGLLEKVQQGGWKSLSAKETGKIGGLMTKKKREQNTGVQKNNQ